MENREHCNGTGVCRSVNISTNELFFIVLTHRMSQSVYKKILIHFSLCLTLINYCLFCGFIVKVNLRRKLGKSKVFYTASNIKPRIKG